MNLEGLTDDLAKIGTSCKRGDLQVLMVGWVVSKQTNYSYRGLLFCLSKEVAALLSPHFPPRLFSVVKLHFEREVGGKG